MECRFRGFRCGLKQNQLHQFGFCATSRGREGLRKTEAYNAAFIGAPLESNLLPPEARKTMKYFGELGTSEGFVDIYQLRPLVRKSASWRQHTREPIGCSFCSDRQGYGCTEVTWSPTVIISVAATRDLPARLSSSFPTDRELRSWVAAS